MSVTGDDPRKARSNQPPLPRQIQEHLGQTLRAQLYEVSPKPQYLGDHAVPREFDSLIERIEMRDRMRRSERIAQAAYQAIEEALRVPAGLGSGAPRKF